MLVWGFLSQFYVEQWLVWFVFEITSSFFRETAKSFLGMFQSQIMSQGQLLEMQLLESRLLDTFFENVNCSTEKSRLLESGKTWFEQLIKKEKLLEISSRWQNFCDSKIKIFNFFHIGKKEKSGTCTA